MILKFDEMELSHLPAFKGGEKEFAANMFFDGTNRIFKGLLVPGASIGVHTHDDSCEVIFILSGNGVLYEKAPVADCGDSHKLPSATESEATSISETEATSISETEATSISECEATSIPESEAEAVSECGTALKESGLIYTEVHPGDCLYCPKGHTHSLKNPQTADSDLVFYAVVPRQ